MNRITSADHYSDLQLFYARLSADSSIHLPLWLEGTGSLSDANQNAQRLMARLSSPRPGQRILDAGCGLGATAIWLAREFGVQVVGISNSASNIDSCRQASRSLGAASLTSFEVADLCEDFGEDFADSEGFDAIWSLESLNYLSPKCRFIERIAKALKPGGIWLCMDRYLDTCRVSPADPAARVLMHGFYGCDHWEPVDVLLGYMKASGFEDIQFQNLTPAVLRTPRRKRVNLASSARAVAGALSNPRSLRAMVRAFRIARASYKLMERGVMTYGLLSGRRPGTPL